MKQMKKLTMKLFCGMLACSLLGGTVCFAAEAQLEKPAAVETSDDSVLTLNFYAGNVKFFRQNGYMTVLVSTEAFVDANVISHDVTIFRNGVWYMSQTYTDWNTDYLETMIDVPAQYGDRIEVYVDHHVDSETRHSAESDMML